MPETAKNENTSQGNAPQPRLVKKRRAGVVLSQQEVKAIQKGRKKLRKELRKKGIKKRKDFELTASSLGLYFDQNRAMGLLLWLFHGRGLRALLAAAAALVIHLARLRSMGVPYLRIKGSVVRKRLKNQNEKS